jgi:UDP-N-acetylglucosamine 1-carboxyvinyltransferase
MDKFVIKEGPFRVSGEISVSGSKNASLPILAASLLFDNFVEIKNLANVKDIDTMLNLLKSLGSRIILSKNKKSVKIYNSKRTKIFASYSIVKTMRAGILVLAPLLAKNKKCVTSSPGGCVIGSRPINYHLHSLKKLGMKYTIKKGYIHASVKNNLIGSTIKFDKISVGATEQILLGSVLAFGRTIIKNCAIEPEILDLINFLKKAGAKIKFIGKRNIQVDGVKFLNSISYSVMGDRIECGTYAVLSALTEGNLRIKGFDPRLIKTEISLLKKAGCKIKLSHNSLCVKGVKKIKSINLITGEYPNFATDLQNIFMVLMCKASGKSTITENIYENRFMVVGELRRLGANIIIKGNKAIIKGNTNFQGAELIASDLRGAVALILAGIASKGTTIVNRVYHGLRGWENPIVKLRKIGVNIKKVS